MNQLFNIHKKQKSVAILAQAILAQAILAQGCSIAQHGTHPCGTMAPKLAEGEATKKGGAKKASKTAKAVKQSISRKQSKMRINIHFFRPKTLTKKRPEVPEQVRRARGQDGQVPDHHLPGDYRVSHEED